jgi:hypothetical protein
MSKNPRLTAGDRVSTTIKHGGLGMYKQEWLDGRMNGEGKFVKWVIGCAVVEHEDRTGIYHGNEVALISKWNGLMVKDTVLAYKGPERTEKVGKAVVEELRDMGMVLLSFPFKIPGSLEVPVFKGATKVTERKWCKEWDSQYCTVTKRDNNP